VRRSRARSSVFTRIVVVGVLLFFGYMAAIWVNQSGLWAMIEQYRSGATDADTAESNAATPLIKNPMDPRRSFDSSWQDIFKAADTASLETSGDAAVEQASAADGSYALVTSGSSGPTGNVSIPVSADILAGLAGKTSTIALTVGSGNDTSTQISVECLFPGLGDCGRHRFNVTAERGDFLLRLTLPAGNGTPSPGKIILSSDVTGGGKSIKLFAIRVTEEP
jgi:hypothetical protein